MIVEKEKKVDGSKSSLQYGITSSCRLDETTRKSERYIGLFTVVS